MHRFFYPRSIVVFGASATKINLGSIVLLNNKRNGYSGNLYGVGSREGDLEGVHIYTDINDVPEVPDVAIFLTPAATIPALMEACGRKGIDRIVIESGGFSEYSHGDHSLEQEVLAIADKYKMKVIGPNCVGVSNFDFKMMMPFGFATEVPSGGRVGLIAQSGGVGGSYLRLIGGYGIKPGKFAATGNKLQLDEVDFLDYFLMDPDTDIITMYLEGFKRGRAFFDLARRSDKPIVIQKSNTNPKSAAIARSHTTALSGDDDVATSALRQAALIRVENETDFVNAVQILKLPPMKSRRVAVVSRSGGHAVLTADACAKFGFEMVPFPPAFFEKLKTIYKTRVIAHQNPLDLGEIFDYTIFTDILEEVLKLEEFDGVLFNHLYSASYESQMSRTFLQSISKLVLKYGKPVSIAMISDREEILDVSRQGYPIFSNPYEAVAALNIGATYNELKTARDNRGTAPAFEVDTAVIKSISDRCFAQRRIPLTDEALAACAAAGIKPIKGTVIRDAASASSLPLHFPVAAKLLSRDASHKSDIGGVKVNIPTDKDLIQAVSDMQAAIASLQPAPAIDGFLIQEMAPAGIECLIGARRDPVFGPIVMVGLGGIFVEIFKDRSIRLAPITEPEARSMLKELKALPLLEGARGRKRSDTAALVEVLCKVSGLICACPDIAELDLNPVIVHPEGEGVSVVDARVFFKRE